MSKNVRAIFKKFCWKRWLSGKNVVQCGKTLKGSFSHEKARYPSLRFCGARRDVQLAAGSSVFYNAVLRGDRAAISIGEGTNIQDNCVVHVEYDLPVTVGKNVTVGHGAILHGCTIGDETLIGMGAIVLNGAKIGKNCLIGAGALVTQNAVIRQSAADYRQEAQECKALEEAL